jgi:uncharacterized membrane protein YjjP (DUF1212 family)
MVACTIRAMLNQDARHRAAPLIRRLAKALLIAGVPAQNLEHALSEVASRFGLRAQFFATPTSVMGAMGDDDSQDVFLIRGQSGEVDVSLIDALYDRLKLMMHGEVGVEEERDEIGRILDAPPLYSPVAVIFAYLLLSTAVARVFGGGVFEMATAGAIGLIAGLLSFWASRSETVSRVAVPVAGFLAGLTATLASGFISALSGYLVIVAGLIALLPGLTLTTAARELAAGHLVSGSSRMAGAVMVFLIITFGVAIGRTLGLEIQQLLGQHATEAVLMPLPEWTVYAALVGSTLALTVLFRIQKRRYLWVLLAGLTAFLTSRYGAIVGGPAAGAGLGAIVIGVGGNLYARYADHASVNFNVPGLMILVPGALGLRSLSALLQNDVTAGIEGAFTAALVAVALATGLVLANALFPSRRLL